MYFMSACFLVPQLEKQGRFKRDMSLAEADLVLSKSKCLSKRASSCDLCLGMQTGILEALG